MRFKRSVNEHAFAWRATQSRREIPEGVPGPAAFLLRLTLSTNSPTPDHNGAKGIPHDDLAPARALSSTPDLRNCVARRGSACDEFQSSCREVALKAQPSGYFMVYEKLKDLCINAGQLGPF